MGLGHFGYHERIPESIRDIVMWLCQDTASIAMKWSLYLDLFGVEENRNLLSDTASDAFHLIEESLRADLTLLICRLADPIRSVGRDNLSFARLADAELDNHLQELVMSYRNACEPLIRIRHKTLAHADLNTRLMPDENLLPGVGRQMIDGIIGKAAAILDYVHGKYTDGELRFDGGMVSGADALLFWLQLGRKAHEAGMQITE